MERASKLIRGLRLPGDTFTAEELACGAWPQAVGRTIAAHTRAARLVREHLVVEVEDPVWQKQLWALRAQILRSLEKSLGAGLVGDLEFRVVPRRREPQRAQTMAPAAPVSTAAADEANLIADPVLRSLYKASRKKALA
jgi:predicted nucleic acid-binding Zn ribbon protein